MNRTLLSEHRPFRHIVHRLILLAIGCATLFQHHCAAQTVDPVETARAQGRPALIYFSGSDWCANCKGFSRNILNKPEIQAVSTARYVVYTADRPIRKPLDADTERINAALVQRYNTANVFPLLVVVGTDGSILDRITYDRALPLERYVDLLLKWGATTP